MSRIDSPQRASSSSRSLFSSLTSYVENSTDSPSCDDAHNILKQSNFPTPSERLITGGRKHGVECLHISQRPKLLHETVISQAGKRVYFGISDDNVSPKIDQQSSFAANLLKDLKTRTCMLRTRIQAGRSNWIRISSIGSDLTFLEMMESLIDAYRSNLT